PNNALLVNKRKLGHLTSNNFQIVLKTNGIKSQHQVTTNVMPPPREAEMSAGRHFSTPLGCEYNLSKTKITIYGRKNFAFPLLPQ
ncbi:hypothetical protein ACJX0J_018024, partial [Zea mays]